MRGWPGYSGYPRGWRQPGRRVVKRGDVAPVLLGENSDSVDRSSYLFAETINPVAGALHIMAIVLVHTSAAEIPTSVSACGLTWTLCPGTANGTVPHAGGGRRVLWYYATGQNGTPGTVTISLATLHLSCAYAVIALPGAAIRATRQCTSATANSTTITGTLAALADSLSVHIYALSRIVNEDSAPPAVGGWAELVDRPVTAPAGRLEIAWAKGDIDANPTWATSGGSAILSLEVESAA